MTRFQGGMKRSFDLVVAAAGLCLCAPAAPVIAVLLKITCRGPVLYRQQRIGRNGRPFFCMKFRTMIADAETQGTVTTASDGRVTPIGRFLRTYKIDEFPQLWNVVLGRMSFVGPRPDVPGYADRLEGDDRSILSLRPGITGPASIFFRHEERLLASVTDPVAFNDGVIWPMKVRINRDYLATWSFWKDIGFILITVAPFLNGVLRLVPPPPRSIDEFDRYRNNPTAA